MEDNHFQIEENKKVFADTDTRLRINQELILRTFHMTQNTKVYAECFFSDKEPFCARSRTRVHENLTLLEAKQYVDSGKKTAVLNFANPIVPGGGVLRGADGQEEYLCRASNLYWSLQSFETKKFYDKHKSIRRKNQFNSMFIGTDTVIYSPAVTVFKKDLNYVKGRLNESVQRYTDEWFEIDVITAAAPFFSGSQYILPDGDLQRIYEQRIKNVFETAIENDIEVIILGAWGCGAFHNPPEVVANSFASVLSQKRYFNAFQDVVFAIKRTGIPCSNLRAFNCKEPYMPQDKVFLSVLRIAQGKCEEILKDTIVDTDYTKIYRIDGFEMDYSVSVSRGSFNCKIYASNPFTTRLLGDINDLGRNYLISCDFPVRFETDDGFAGVLCEYVVLFSHSEINISEIYKSYGISNGGDYTKEIISNLHKKVPQACWL